MSFNTFIYPGVLCMSVLFTSLFSAGSIVWDGEFGFLREMLVAPVSRSALVIARITQMQAFMALNQMLVMPLFFLSGALYPLGGLPRWLAIVTRFDPLSYIVDPMRHAVFSHLSIPGAATASIAPGITWNGWEVPEGLSLGIVAVIGVAMLFLAIAQFRKTE